MRSTALASIPVAVVVERRKARSMWAEYLWTPVEVFLGEPAAEPWTSLGANPDSTLFYAGTTAIELHRTETSYYHGNTASAEPKLWVILRPVASGHPYQLLAVTADPSEGEAFTDAGSNVVEAVPMPAAIVEIVGDFVSRYHVERPFEKRRRQPADTMLSRRGEEQERS